MESEPEEEAILERRTQLGIDKITQICVKASKLEAIFLDDGFLPDEILPLEWHEQFVPVQRILRLEYLAENLMSEVEDFRTFLERFRMPVQFHTGFGDPDLDLRLGNPLYMRSLLEDRRFRNAPIVLLHASYPYAQEAGYLASVYPQVYLDFGLAVPFLSVAGMRSTLQQLLELAPTSKLMYSSDAHNIPELYYLGAKWGREVLGQVLDGASELPTRLSKRL